MFFLSSYFIFGGHLAFGEIQYYVNLTVSIFVLFIVQCTVSITVHPTA